MLCSAAQWWEISTLNLHTFLSLRLCKKSAELNMIKVLRVLHSLTETIIKRTKNNTFFFLHLFWVILLEIKYYQK